MASKFHACAVAAVTGFCAAAMPIGRVTPVGDEDVLQLLAGRCGVCAPFNVESCGAGMTGVWVSFGAAACCVGCAARN
jgi:hypothetical protein